MFTVGDVLAHKLGRREPEKIYWRGSPIGRCQVCSRPVVDVAYDACVPGSGTWGLLGEECFTRYRCELGVGKGQRYVRQPDGRWLRTGG